MLQAISIYLIEEYQKHIRRALPECCRFWPSCSDYAKEALIKYGFFKGLLKALKRLFQCHPFSRESGYDPLT